MTNNNMDKMLKTASGKLGVTPDELKSILNKGDMNALFDKMGNDDAKKLKDAMANPKVADILKTSPEMADFMKKMNEKQ
ncbi:MAG: hypothetical protein FWG33_01875 [Oscillospiraceae bacterium]|nr:hypothetical protein [Oscillospiraceae bacterium]